MSDSPGIRGDEPHKPVERILGWQAIGLLLGIFAILLSVLIGTSESFERCVHERKNHQAYQALHEKRALFVKSVVRLELHVACARVTAGENDGAVTALATILIAIFTLALWRSTNKLWIADLESRDDMRAHKHNEAD